MSKKLVTLKCGAFVHFSVTKATLKWDTKSELMTLKCENANKRHLSACFCLTDDIC